MTLRALNYGNYGIFRTLGNESDKLDLGALRVKGLGLKAKNRPLRADAFYKGLCQRLGFGCGKQPPSFPIPIDSTAR